jgi:carbonic anhydrase
MDPFKLLWRLIIPGFKITGYVLAGTVEAVWGDLESVLWLVLKSPMIISADELDAFAKIYPPNAWPTPPLNDRTVRETK